MRCPPAAIRYLLGISALVLSWTTNSRADVFSNVPEAVDFQTVYSLNIPVTGGFSGSTSVPYSVDNSASIAPGTFDRVAYYLELTSGTGTVTWAYASMDAFTGTASQLGLPHNINNPVTFQRMVNNLTVASNVSSVTNASYDQGGLQFWFESYTAPSSNSVMVSATDYVPVYASSGSWDNLDILSQTSYFDWGDTITGTSPGTGAFQVSAPSARQVILAYNGWATTGTSNDDIGIGNRPGNSNVNWTGAANAGSYTARTLVVLVRPKRFNVNFTAIPKSHQVTPRNLTTNTATIPIAGAETLGGFTNAVLRVFRNNVQQGSDIVQPLVYTSGTATFSFNPTITAELASYSFQIYVEQGTTPHLVRSVSDVVAGDVYLMYGQSNAQAVRKSDSADAFESQWVRTFGESNDAADITEAYPFWVQATGDSSLDTPAGVGQWALYVADQIATTYGIPVAMINGAHGGYAITQLQKDRANPDQLSDSPPASGPTTYRVYNRMRYRAIQANVNNGVRGIFYYQGESDTDNTAQHVAGFAELMQDWAVDYPNVQRITVCQLHTSYQIVTRELPALRDAQRRFEDVYSPLVKVMSTNGLYQYTDSTHYPFAQGYKVLGQNVFRQIARDLYGAADSPDIDPPNAASVQIIPPGNELQVTLRRSGAGITIDPGIMADFRLDGMAANLLSVTYSIDKTSLLLQYDRPIVGGTGLDYLAHMGPFGTGGNVGPWIRNANGVGLITFSEPLQTVNPVPALSLLGTTGSAVNTTPGQVINLSASASTQTGNLTNIEAWVDGVLLARVTGKGSQSALTLSTNWTVPDSGNHSYQIDTANSGGFENVKDWVTYGSAPSSPGGVTSGLVTWLRPESNVTLDSSGHVSQWLDSSGNGIAFTQSTASARPAFAINQFGVLPGIAFSGSNYLTGNLGASGTGSYTKIVRVHIDTLNSNPLLANNVLSSGTGTGVGHALYTNGSTSPTTPELYHGAVFVTGTTPVQAAQGYVLAATYDAPSKVAHLYIDGTLVASGTAANNNPLISNYQLGAYQGSGFLVGGIGETMIYNRALSGTEVSTVQSYMNTRLAGPAPATPATYASWSATNIPAGLDSTPTGSANAQGISNLVEYALGLNPAATVPPTLLTVTPLTGGVDVSYDRPTNRGDLAYQLQESTDLNTWNTVTDLPGPAASGIEERDYSRSAAVGQKYFYRLRITQTQ